MSTWPRVSPLLIGLHLCCGTLDKCGTCGPKLFFELVLDASSLKNMSLCCKTRRFQISQSLSMHDEFKPLKNGPLSEITDL